MVAFPQFLGPPVHPSVGGGYAGPHPNDSGGAGGPGGPAFLGPPVQQPPAGGLPGGPHDFSTLLQNWMQQSGGQVQAQNPAGDVRYSQIPGWPVGPQDGPQFLGPPVHPPGTQVPGGGHPPNYLGPPVHGEPSGDHSSQYPVFWSAMQGLMDHVAKQYRDQRPPKAYRG
jgi:hypothetical protein